MTDDRPSTTTDRPRARVWPAVLGVLTLSVAGAWGQVASEAAGTPAAGAGRESAMALVQDAPDGPQVFADNCASCHGADGEGVPGTFPPLAGNPNAADPEHVSTVVNNGLSGPIEVLGQSYDGEMPALALAEDEVAAVTEFVTGLAGGGDGGEPTTTTVASEPPEAGDVTAGEDLFVGRERLAAGGPACAACHAAGSVDDLGGSGLGPNLTLVSERLSGEAGLTAWLTNPPTPTMTQMFGDHPMTAAEIADLSVFLVDAPQQDEPDHAVDLLLVGGLVGALVLLAGMAMAYRGMRQTYAERLTAKSGVRR